MEYFDEEILNFWKQLNHNNVQYIIVGGFAVNLHGVNRFTADLDIWLKDTPENRKNLRKACNQFGMGDIEGIETIDFVPGWSSLNLPSGFELDIMTFIKGFKQERFDDCYQQATIAEVHEAKIRFLDIEHLIEAKKAAARPQDIIDTEELEKLNR